jgi:hypothetical protein
MFTIDVYHLHALEQNLIFGFWTKELLKIFTVI